MSEENKNLKFNDNCTIESNIEKGIMCNFSASVPAKSSQEVVVGSRVILLPSPEMEELYMHLIGKEGTVLSINSSNEQTSYEIQTSNRIISIHQPSIEVSSHNLSHKSSYKQSHSTTQVKIEIKNRDSLKGVKYRLFKGQIGHMWVKSEQYWIYQYIQTLGIKYNLMTYLR